MNKELDLDGILFNNHTLLHVCQHPKLLHSHGVSQENSSPSFKNQKTPLIKKLAFSLKARDGWFAILSH